MERSHVGLGRRIRNIGRLAQITNVLARHGLWSLAERLNIPKWLSPEQIRQAEELSKSDDASASDPSTIPVRLRRCLEELGPAFVKLGQVLASREDLVPPAYVAELCKLHQNVAPVPFSEIREIIKSEWGESSWKQFDAIIEEPLAAGSIGQVHEGFLKSGERVIIKVQRPHIRHQIQLDLWLMEDVAVLIERYLPDLRFIRPRAVVSEFARNLKAELDFIREAGNTEKFSQNFSGVASVEVPKIYWEFTTDKTIVQSYMEGISAWEKDKMIAAGLRPSVLVERAFNAFLQMVFVDGFYHADLHPGNLMALEGDHVGLIDFGSVVALGRAPREHLAGMLVAIVQQDFETAAVHLSEMSDPGSDFRLEAFQSDVADALAPFIGLRISKIRSGKLLWDLAHISARHDAPLPNELVLFIKTLAVFEGVGIHLDPNFDVIGASQKFTGKIVEEMYSAESIKRQGMLISRDLASLARFAPYQLRRILRSAVDGEFRMRVDSQQVLRLAESLDRSSARLAVSIGVGSLIVGSSILADAEVGDRYFDISLVGIVGFSIAGILALYLIWSILRGR